jgi:hypothetical protein
MYSYKWLEQATGLTFAKANFCVDQKFFEAQTSAGAYTFILMAGAHGQSQFTK